MKKILLTLTLLISGALPVRAQWNGLSQEQVQNCVNHIYNFQQIKNENIREVSRIGSPSSATFGRDIAILYAQYNLDVAYIEVNSQCGGEYNTQAIAFQMYQQNFINTPSITKYLGF